MQAANCQGVQEEMRAEDKPSDGSTKCSLKDHRQESLRLSNGNRRSSFNSFQLGFMSDEERMQFLKTTLLFAEKALSVEDKDSENRRQSAPETGSDRRKDQLERRRSSQAYSQLWQRASLKFIAGKRISAPATYLLPRTTSGSSFIKISSRFSSTSSSNASTSNFETVQEDEALCSRAHDTLEEAQEESSRDPLKTSRASQMCTWERVSKLKAKKYEKVSP
jgi:hypothetical protein